MIIKPHKLYIKNMVIMFNMVLIVFFIFMQNFIFLVMAELIFHISESAECFSFLSVLSPHFPPRLRSVMTRILEWWDNNLALIVVANEEACLITERAQSVAAEGWGFFLLSWWEILMGNPERWSWQVRAADLSGHATSALNTPAASKRHISEAWMYKSRKLRLPAVRCVKEQHFSLSWKNQTVAIFVDCGVSGCCAKSIKRGGISDPSVKH